MAEFPPRCTFNTPLEMHELLKVLNQSIKIETFNTPLEMLGVLVFGFCGFLSFCVGVCGFLVGAC